MTVMMVPLLSVVWILLLLLMASSVVAAAAASNHNNNDNNDNHPTDNNSLTGYHNYWRYLTETKAITGGNDNDNDTNTFPHPKTNKKEKKNDAVNNNNNNQHQDNHHKNNDLDCGMRQLFWQQAQKAVPWRSPEKMQDIYQALELDQRCDGRLISSRSNNKATNTIQQQQQRRGRRLQAAAPDISSTIHHQNSKDDPNNKKDSQDDDDDEDEDDDHDDTNVDGDTAIIFYVCPHYGQDRGLNDTGIIDSHQDWSHHPFRTLHAAVEATRFLRQLPGNRNATFTIVLQPGIHYLSSTLTLTPDDSHLALQGSQAAWISGGFMIPTELAGWQPHNDNNNIWIAKNISSLLPPSTNKVLTGLFTVDPHTRLTLARYPNADVEEWNAPQRYLTIQDKFDSNDSWIFPPVAGVPHFTYYNLTDPHNPTGHVKNDSTMPDYNSYGTGQGGACATVWHASYASYWCSNVSAGGWANVDRAAAEAGRLNLPAGLFLASTSSSKLLPLLSNKWNLTQAKGAIFQVAHSQGWAWHMFNVSTIHVDDNGATIQFDQGGWQGGRNWECWDPQGRMTDCNGEKKLHGGPWYVEGILEELDAPGELYWDADTQQLYLYPPVSSTSTITTAASTPPPDLIGTNLQTLIKMEGTQENPVRNIRLEGLKFRDAAKTYMEPWAAPSGGDWALHRGGAVHLEGTENVTVIDCTFTRLDGNAILLGGYNRHTHVTRSEFSWMGEGAMATWGDSDGYDATRGAQPRFSVIESNVMSNLGLYQKQSSAWGQNKACQNIIRNNVMFNLPRAAINFNDGLGGGNLVEGNVIFNTCRESGDHGPINSWDRMPFSTETTGSPSFASLPTHTQKNIILANYGASEGFDNDDGSSFYYTHDNVFYQSDGFKMDFGGHSSRFTNNFVYADGRKVCYGTGSFKEGQADVFSNNTCIVPRGPKDDVPQLGHIFQCSLIGMNPFGNRYYTVDGNGTFGCGSQLGLSLSAMQEKGYEVGSTIGTLPSTETILQWASETLA